MTLFTIQVNKGEYLLIPDVTEHLIITTSNEAKAYRLSQYRVIIVTSILRSFFKDKSKKFIVKIAK